MKNLVMLLLFLGLLSAIAAPAFADGIAVTVNEGTSQLLGRVVQPGSVGLCDIPLQNGVCPAPLAQNASDIVIWVAILDDTGKQVDTRVSMCSNPGAAADQGDANFPSDCLNTNLNPVIIQEAGVENGTESTPWQPGTSGPGAASAGDVSYNLISDGTPVPEPSSMLMLGSGLLGVVAALRRKQRGQ